MLNTQIQDKICILNILSSDLRALKIIVENRIWEIKLKVS